MSQVIGSTEPPREKYKVFVVGPARLSIIKLFMDCRPLTYRGAKSAKDADVVVFTGGPDIDPQLYGQKALTSTFFKAERDEEDLRVWGESGDAVKVGICRGAQFLNVMNGGSLWQDVDNHRRPHDIYDFGTGKSLRATSTHHQMMIPGPDALVVAGSYDAFNKRSFGIEWARNPHSDTDDEHDIDAEVVWYDKTLSFCFQPHPEHIGATADLKHYFFGKLWSACRQRELQKGLINACAV